MKEMSEAGLAGRARISRISNYVAGCGGFSLAELMVALLLLAVIFSFALPALKNPYASNSLYAGARQMAGHMREIQQTAIAERKASYKIYFKVLSEENEYFIYDNLKLIKKYRLPANVRIVDANFADSRLGFGSAGKPYPTGGHVTLENSNGELLYVIVAVHSGRVRIDDKPPQ